MLQGQLELIIDQIDQLRFEMILLGGSLLFLVLSLFIKSNVKIRVLYAAVIVAALLFGFNSTDPDIILTGSIKVGPFESFFKVLLAAFSIWIVFYSTAKKHTFEFYFLILAILIGSSFMLSANNLLVLYIAVELTSFSAYLLTNFNFSKRSFEAGLKYLIFGGVSSAIMLYGISILYGLGGGTLSFEQMSLSDGDPFLMIGIVALVGGLFFKLSAFPFHIWTPSAYEEAPSDAVAVLSVLPKLAGFVLLHRFVFTLDSWDIDWIYPLIAVAGIATITVGTLGALKQTNIKRLLAYGAITHSGLLLGCLLVAGQSGMTAFIWYALIYALMNLALFYLTSILEENGITSVAQLSGLGKLEAYFGGLMVIILISLIGLPPTAGFMAKFYLFASLWQEFQSISDYYIFSFLIIGVLSVLFSLFYYLRMPYFYFIKTEKSSSALKLDWFQKLFATILALLLLWLFITPQILNNIVSNFHAVPW